MLDDCNHDVKRPVENVERATALCQGADFIPELWRLDLYRTAAAGHMMNLSFRTGKKMLCDSANATARVA